MIAPELSTEMTRAFRDMQDDMKDMADPTKPVSYDRFMASVDRFFDAKEALAEFHKLKAKNPALPDDMEVDEILKAKRKARFEARFASTKKWLETTGKGIATCVLGAVQKTCNAGLNALNKGAGAPANP